MHLHIYIYLHEPEFSTVTPVMTLVSIVSLHDLANLNFSVFCEVFLKLRRFGQQYYNFSERAIICLADPIMFR